MRKIYLSGAITGVPNYVAIFEEKEAELQLAGWEEVINPVKIGEVIVEAFRVAGIDVIPYSAFMREDLKAILRCSHICMLENWTKSKGAIIEYIVAKVCGLIVIYGDGKEKKKDFYSWGTIVKLLMSAVKDA